MHPQMQAIRCSIMRGGTSKGIFLMENDLPTEPLERERVIRAIFGSPDVRQIDGLGGADVLTSKLAIIGPPTIAGADVDYTFGQVSFIDEIIDFKGNCGNISSAVGPFAIDAGLVAAVEPVATVRIHMTNSGRILTARVPVTGGKAAVCGDYSIDGVPGAGAKIAIDWSQSVGAFTGKLLPTGNAVDVLTVGGAEYPVSLVDAGNVLVFIAAESLGLAGTESPQEIESNAALMELIERIRGEGAARCGLIGKAEDSRTQAPYNPFFAIVSPPAGYAALNSKAVGAGDLDVVSRLVFMQRMHKTYPITGTVATAAAARIPGSLVHRMIPPGLRGEQTVRIGHPGGVIDAEIETETVGETIAMTRIYVHRTARKIMDGVVYIKNLVKQER